MSRVRGAPLGSLPALSRMHSANLQGSLWLVPDRAGFNIACPRVQVGG